MAEKAVSAEAGAATGKLLSPSPASEKKDGRNEHASPAHQTANQDSPVNGKQPTNQDSPVNGKQPANQGSPVNGKQPANQGSPVNGKQPANQGSPVNGKQTDALSPPPAVSEKKPHVNGHASPIRLPANSSAGNEGYLKTDDRMRLAKERREERERSLAVREQAIREKEQRARLQYERTVEERWRRLEEQRLKEEQRRAAVEEKRRQQLEEEKERLEALMRRSLERSLHLENRNKRWMWGPNGGVQSDWENSPHFSAASALPHDLAAPSPAANESGNVQHGHLTSLENLTHHRLHTHTHSSLARCNSAANLGVPCSRCTVSSSPHRSPYRGSPSRRRGNAVSTEESGRGSNTAPSTPKKERLRNERRDGSPAVGSPARRAESPATIVRRSASPATPKLSPKRRNQSPVTIRQYPPSPLRHKPNPPATDNKADDKATINKQTQEAKAHDPANKKLLNAEETAKQLPNNDPANKAEKQDKVSPTLSPLMMSPKVENSNPAAKVTNKGQKSPDEKSSVAPETKSLKTSTGENDVIVDRSTDRSPLIPNGKVVAGTTDAEEASRLLAERRRLARIHKEQEDQERLKAEQLKNKKQAEEQEDARRAEKQLKAKREEVERKKRDEEEKKKEEAGVRALKEAERQRQERELQKQHEEEERQQRKKRIEEIMKRTRKGDGEMKREDSQEPQSPSSQQTLLPPGEMQVKSKVNGNMKPPLSSPPGTHGKPGAPEPVSRQEKVEMPSTNEGKHTPAEVHLKIPLPNGQTHRANSIQQREDKSEHVKTQSHSSLREEGVRDEICSVKKVTQLVSKTDNSIPKPEVKPPVQVPFPSPPKQVNNTILNTVPMVMVKKEANTQGKNGVSQQVKEGGQVETAQQKSTIKMTNHPQVNGARLQLNTHASAVQVMTPNGQTSSQATVTKVVVKENSSASFSPLAVSKAPPPLTNLQHLEGKGGAGKQSTDEVQSMEISPVSKEELVSIPEFSPVADVQHNGMSNARALEDLLDLTGHVAYPRHSPALGDCNKNLIEGVCSPGSDSKVIHNSSPSSNKLNTQ